MVNIIRYFFCTAFVSTVLLTSAQAHDGSASSSQFKRDLIQDFSELTGLPASEFDEATLTYFENSGKLSASILNRSGETGFFLTPGVKIGDETRQEPGVHVLSSAPKSDSMDQTSIQIYGERASDRFEFIYIMFTQGATVTGRLCPGLSCGCWADPELASQCNSLAACLYVGGVACDSTPPPPQ
jgi:hypothetical protein